MFFGYIYVNFEEKYLEKEGPTLPNIQLRGGFPEFKGKKKFLFE